MLVGPSMVSPSMIVGPMGRSPEVVSGWLGLSYCSHLFQVPDYYVHNIIKLIVSWSQNP